MLRILSVEAPRVVATGSLLRQAWGAHLDPNVRSEAHRVRAFVRKLRTKLGDDAGAPRLILNERGVGYRMAAPERNEGGAGGQPRHASAGARTDARHPSRLPATPAQTTP